METSSINTMPFTSRRFELGFLPVGGLSATPQGEPATGRVGVERPAKLALAKTELSLAKLAATDVTYSGLLDFAYSGRRSGWLGDGPRFGWQNCDWLNLWRLRSLPCAAVDQTTTAETTVGTVAQFCRQVFSRFRFSWRKRTAWRWPAAISYPGLGRFALLTLLSGISAASGEVIRVVSTLDSSQQPALVDLPPPSDQAVPLLVHLHSWSSRYDNSNNFAEARAEAKRRGWAFVSPDFRGVNDHPEACGSELAVQDVLDAVAQVQQMRRIDGRKVYLVGVSGGGYMALLLAARAPERWAAVSAWVPISDLAAWHAFSQAKGARYAKMIEGCFGAAPTHGNAAQQVRRRSPVHFLQLAKGVPLDINTGIRDGHEGSVPVSEALRAFNAVAEPNARIPEGEIRELTASPAVPARFKPESLRNVAAAEGRQKQVLYRRRSGAARVTVFEGGHEGDFAAAAAWLEQFAQPEAAVITKLQDGQLLPRETRERGNTGKAQLPMPEVRGGTLQVRVNEGPWQVVRKAEEMPALATGGPYTVRFRVAGVEVVRQNLLVGDLYVLAGQSNMVGRAPLVDPAPSHPMVRALTPQDTWEVARDPIHEAIPRDGRTLGIGLGLPFAKELVRRTGVPIGLVPCAIGGTSLEQWNPSHRGQLRRSLYGNLLARVALALPAGVAEGAKARLAGVLWYQGEADAGKKETAQSYTERFLQFAATLRKDLADPELPLYYAQLARNVVPDSQAPGWDIVREAQRQMETELQPGGMVATVDLPLTDPIHLNRQALEVLGRRMAKRVLDGPGPSLRQVHWESPTRLRLQFTQRLVAPVPGRIHGFTLGAPAVFLAEQEIRSGDIVLHIGPTSNLELYYCRGVDAVCELTTAAGQALPALGPVPLPARPKLP